MSIKDACAIAEDKFYVIKFLLSTRTFPINDMNDRIRIKEINSSVRKHACLMNRLFCELFTVNSENLIDKMCAFTFSCENFK